ncbi:aspartate/ornithine carbamoyltransferase Asp/Orn-binding region [Coriobacterium glomerans PW2]|uniref:Aspartate/ornithine carbamoyltransferase Asp/Orn-binding region n=1 Tax=Coriobacterium glomerans (strain ATCC 49209 / DSM 20642 / JCM 10262 / PW2) TaxID=700015 RepID=F2NB05_CORGP|nr:putrescine carbamoyltransferase [Coriobacterium glomerans]AEB07683.1 aspartate/ornithine carbamoyltransferase Asp/Orn-binding region [Coriobacterium glomerans PW2]
MVKDFIDTNDFSSEEIRAIVELAAALKTSIKQGLFHPHLLRDKSLGVISFQIPALTRIPLEVAMCDLGGHSAFLDARCTASEGCETLGDSARVMGALLDILAAHVRCHRDVIALAASSAAPVLNAMSDYNHPTQEITDLLTMLEHLPSGKRIDECRIVYVGGATQVCASLMFICSKMGMDFVQFAPSGHQLSDGARQIDSDFDLLAIGRRNCEISGASVTVSDDLESVRDADYIYTDAWHRAVRDETSSDDHLRAFPSKYQVTPALMALAGSEAKFMHCLPACRGEEVVDEVIDGPKSLCWVQAENRKHAIRALLATFGPRTALRDEIIEYAGREELHRALDKIDVLQA